MPDLVSSTSILNTSPEKKDKLEFEDSNEKISNPKIAEDLTYIRFNTNVRQDARIEFYDQFNNQISNRIVQRENGDSLYIESDTDGGTSIIIGGLSSTDTRQLAAYVVGVDEGLLGVRSGGVNTYILVEPNKYSFYIGATQELLVESGTVTSQTLLPKSAIGGTDIGSTTKRYGNTHLYDGKYIEFKTGVAPSGGGTGTARLYVDTSGGKEHPMIQIYF